MNNTTTIESYNSTDKIGIILPVVLLAISELLPFLPNRYQGILQSISLVIKDIYKHYR